MNCLIHFPVLLFFLLLPTTESYTQDEPFMRRPSKFPFGSSTPPDKSPLELAYPELDFAMVLGYPNWHYITSNDKSKGGYVNYGLMKDGEKVLPMIFNLKRQSPHMNGFSRYQVLYLDIYCGIFDIESEKWVIPPKYHHAYLQRNNSYCVTKSHLESYGLVKLSQGKVLLGNIYSDIHSLGEENEDKYIVKTKAGKFGLFDAESETFILNAKYDVLKYIDDETIFCEKDGIVQHFDLSGKPKDLRIGNNVKLRPLKNCMKSELNGYFGLVDAKGNEILPPKYLSIEQQYENEYFIVQNNQHKFGLVDILGAEIFPFVYDSLLSEGFPSLKKNDKWGHWFIASKPKIAIPPIYDTIQYLNFGSHIAIKDGKMGVVSRFDEEIIPFEYEKLERIGCDYKSVKLTALKNGKYGILDAEGNIITPFKYKKMKISGEHDYICLVTQSDDGRYGLLSKDGKSLLPNLYDNIEDFIGFPYIFFVITKNGKEGLYNGQSGRIIFEPQYDLVYIFSHDFRALLGQQVYAHTDNGNTKCPMILDTTELSYTNHELYISTDGDRFNLWEYHNYSANSAFTQLFKNGKIYSPPMQNSHFSVFRKNYRYVVKSFGNRSGLFDLETETWKINPKYESLELIDEDLLKVGEYTTGLIDFEENVILPFDKQRITNLADTLGLVLIENNGRQVGKSGLFDKKKRNFLIPYGDYKYKTANLSYMIVYSNNEFIALNYCTGDVSISSYDSIALFNYSNFIVRKNGRYGVLGDSGQILIPLEYQSIVDQVFSDKSYLVAKGIKGRFGLLDRKNEIQIPFEMDTIINYMGLVFSQKGGKWAIANISKSDSLVYDFDSYFIVHSGCCKIDKIVATQKNGCTLFDAEGQKVDEYKLPYKATHINTDNFLLYVESPKGEKGAYDTSLELVVPVEFDALVEDEIDGYFKKKSKYIVTIKNEKEGLFDLENKKELVKPRFESIVYSGRDDKIFYGINGSSIFYIDKESGNVKLVE